MYLRSLACHFLVLAACGPVLLLADPDADAPFSGNDPAPWQHAALEDAAAADGGMVSTTADQLESPSVVVDLKQLDCGRCFELVANGVDGQPPYVYDWDDGSQGQLRRVCPDVAGAQVSVIAKDAKARRSTPYMAMLQRNAHAVCSASPAVEPSRLCVANPSFEGTPAPNLGGNFDANPWNACTDSDAANTPDIVDQALLQTFSAPAPQHGVSYLALAEGEQTSQTLCENVTGGNVLYFELDLATFDVTAGVMPATGPVYMEIYGGLAADCTQPQLLWTSEPLTFSWQRFCVKLAPSDFMDQITLRAKGDPSDTQLSYLIADNLVPVENCP